MELSPYVAATVGARQTLFQEQFGKIKIGSFNCVIVPFIDTALTADHVRIGFIKAVLLRNMDHQKKKNTFVLFWPVGGCSLAMLRGQHHQLGWVGVAGWGVVVVQGREPNFHIMNSAKPPFLPANPHPTPIHVVSIN